MPESEAVTNGIRVHVESRYSPEHSNPAQNEYFFIYTIRIRNEGDQVVQLRSRSWTITDAEGKTQHVQGAGVAGKQPVLQPGDEHEYTSGCPLTTPFGSMRGSYTMATRGGGSFAAEIAPFELQQPYGVH